MATKAEMNALVRRRLEDASVAPLWDDATIDDALADGLSRYGAFVPLEMQSSVIVASGATGFSVTGLESGQAIRQVFAPNGRLVPAAVAACFEASTQTWRWWAGQILLAKPAAGGTWIVEWRKPRLLPANDGDAMPARAGDEGAVSLFAAASAIRRRAVEEAKRGGRSIEALVMLAGEWERAAELHARGINRAVHSFILLER
jgi:hypothetical protein